MSVSAFWLKWGLRFYPPLLFQRIWLVSIGRDFKTAEVIINKSFLNRNYNRSIFGGTLFSAVDPFYPVMFHQVFIKKGFNVIVWSKSAQIQFLKPSLTAMYFKIMLSESMISNAEESLISVGKFSGLFDINIHNKTNEICVTVTCEVYIRNVNFIETTII